MKTILLFVTLLISGVSAQASQLGDYRGYFAVQRTVAERGFLPYQAPELAAYVVPSGTPVMPGVIPSVVDLLGIYGGNLNADFKNGTPNVVSVLVYHVMFSGFSKDLGSLCDSASPDPFKLRAGRNPSLTAALESICAWPAESARTEDTLFSYWTLWMGFDAPQEEFEAWQDFVLKTYSNSSAVETVNAISLAIFLNPHFLLRK